MTMSDQQLPQSNVLAEAAATSLSEMLSTDPEKITPEIELRIIQALRDQRARFAEAEAAGKPVPRVGKGEKKTAKTILSSLANVDDLGL
jgi:hypothetical protein